MITTPIPAAEQPPRKTARERILKELYTAAKWLDSRHADDGPQLAAERVIAAGDKREDALREEVERLNRLADGLAADANAGNARAEAAEQEVERLKMAKVSWGDGVLRERDHLREQVEKHERKRIAAINWHNEYQTSQAELVRERKCRQEYLETAKKYQSLVAAAEQERDTLRGPVGPYEHCHSCGRLMVWQRPSNADNYGSWMCPNCVLREADTLRERVKELESKLAYARDIYGTPCEEVSRIQKDQQRDTLRQENVQLHDTLADTLRQLKYSLEEEKKAREERLTMHEEVERKDLEIKKKNEAYQRELNRLYAEIKQLYAEIKQLKEQLDTREEEAAAFKEQCRIAQAAHVLCDKERQTLVDRVTMLEKNLRDVQHHFVDPERRDYRDRLDGMVAAIAAGYFASPATLPEYSIEEQISFAAKRLAAIDAHLAAKREDG